MSFCSRGWGQSREGQSRRDATLGTGVLQNGVSAYPQSTVVYLSGFSREAQRPRHTKAGTTGGASKKNVINVHQDLDGAGTQDSIRTDTECVSTYAPRMQHGQ